MWRLDPRPPGMDSGRAPNFGSRRERERARELLQHVLFAGPGPRSSEMGVKDRTGPDPATLLIAERRALEDDLAAARHTPLNHVRVLRRQVTTRECSIGECGGFVLKRGGGEAL